MTNDVNTRYKNTLMRSVEKWHVKEMLKYFHEPDSFSKNYYYIDLKQQLVFLLPSRLDAGPIIVNLYEFLTRTIILNSGKELHIGDIIWKESSSNLDCMYPTATLDDPDAGCGKFTCALHLALYGLLYRTNLRGNWKLDHRNGNKNDERMINLEFKSTAANCINTHKNGYDSTVPTIQCPDFMIDYIKRINAYKNKWYSLPAIHRHLNEEAIDKIIQDVVTEYEKSGIK